MTKPTLRSALPVVAAALLSAVPASLMADSIKPFSDAVEASQEAMGLSAFVITSKPTDGFGPLEANLKDHQAYLHELEKRGVLLMAGPLSDTEPEEWSGDGLLIYLAQDEAAARKIADGDPLHRSGARTYTVRRWLINEGSVTVRLRLSDQSSEFVRPSE